MIKKSFRFPTTLLYKQTQVLSVRKLYLLKITLLTHKDVLKLPVEDMARKRVFKLPIIPVNTEFAKRFSTYMKTIVYNNFTKILCLRNLSLREVKTKITKELMDWTYDRTELFIRHLL
ncbi:hypothetical protein PYW07_011400 [Mythimna separata]|uniref:Uncharacterized protein n=1 Tax=Mythimna separata TaxID=271217 RepID=A0AAD7Y9M1_MYTSE|nr:hypothetical protein PYW07_011400 [Mythimna separata]